MTPGQSIELERLALQAQLDIQKTQKERNRLGQFATPTELAQDIVSYGLGLMEPECLLRFLEPAFGTGPFYSALLRTVEESRIGLAKGIELDPHYAEPARYLWKNELLDLEVADFTTMIPPAEEALRYSFIICNPPYVRHHHIVNGDKIRLQEATEAACGIRIGGLAGLYCYFLCIAHSWMQQGGIAGWLIPSEFMDVKYGEAVKRYLLDRVTLLRIHRFDPNDVQFEDALVSSAVVWFRNELPKADHQVEFSYGGSLSRPEIVRTVPAAALRKEAKWTRFPVSDVRQEVVQDRLSDFFTIKRGIATGDNHFFILTPERIEANNLPIQFFRPILPSPRYVPDEVKSDEMGLPIVDRQLFLLDCRLPETVVEEKFPSLWAYLEKGKGSVSERYLCKSRKVWYFQDERPPAPILCTYIGRSDTKSGRPFRFILNHSQATAANVYLMLYPKPVIATAFRRDVNLLRQIWGTLNALSPSSLLGEGRVYGGGLHKVEPKELGNVNATQIAQVLRQVTTQTSVVQAGLFDGTSV